MNWLAAIGVGLLSAPITGFIIGTAATLWIDWMRVPQREGGAAYLLVMISVLAALIAFVVGILVARGVIISDPSFGKAVVVTSGIAAMVATVTTGVVWLAADLPPKVDGRRLQLLVELRYPPRTPLEGDRLNGYVALLRGSDGHSRGYGSVNVENAREVDGRYVIAAELPLETSEAKKLLSVVSEEFKLTFPVGFGSKPQQADFEWSGWTPHAAPHADFSIRYRVQVEPAPPPRISPEQRDAALEAVEEAKLAALTPDTPLAQWLVFTRYGTAQHRIDTAAAAIRARPRFVEEMSYEMLQGSHEASRDALRAVEHIQPPPYELARAIAQVGDDIAASIKSLPTNAPADDQPDAHADISTRFSAWMAATLALQGRGGVDFVPQLQAIIEPARTHDQSYVLQIDVVRVASFYLKEWAGIEPLPTDPPPR